MLTELKKLPRLENAQLGGKRVLLGVDYDDSLAFSSSPSGNPSLLPILSTVNFLLERGASIYIFSHSASFSPSNLATQLSKSLEREVDCISFPLSTEARESHLNISQGNISVLEIAKGTLEGSGNLSSLSHDLISLGSIFVNEARRSNQMPISFLTKLPEMLPSYAGLGLFQQVEFLAFLSERKRHPQTLILGGVDLESKLNLLKTLLPDLDNILVGGALAYTFLHSLAVPVGNSIKENSNLVTDAFQFLSGAELQRVHVQLPEDHITAHSLTGKFSVKKKHKILDNEMGVDIGPKSLLRFQKILSQSESVLWYGPMGLCKKGNPSISTQKIAKYLAKSSFQTFVIGRDTSLAVYQAGVEEKMAYVEPDSSFVIDVVCKKNLHGLSVLQRS